MRQKTDNQIIQLYIGGIKKLGGQYKLYSNNVLLCKKGKKEWYIHNMAIPVNTVSSNRIQRDKFLACRILKEHKIPVPKQRLFSHTKSALSSISLDKPLIVKPFDNVCGQGVSCKITSRRQLGKFFSDAKRFSNKVLVEDFVDGSNYRFLVLGDKVISVVQRIKPHVIGDGRSKIRTLIRRENQKRTNHQFYKPLLIDDHTVIKLRQQKLDLDSVPPKGRRVVLRDTCNLAQGGTTEEVIDRVHKKNLDTVIKAVKLLGLKAAGVDMITKDVSKDITKNHGVINELNSNFDLTVHYAAKDCRVDAAYEIQKFIYENM